ncbi:MAG TPA: outer membrane beta-barrel domain-containing protein [Polyangia bacterium]|nr:outer membrane beta-barrel domain-containing protein [Polyangia bacterium]
MPRATTVVLALAFGLTSSSVVLAAPATGKPQDNPFDERSGADAAAGAQGQGEEEEEQGKKPADEAKPPPARDEGATGEPEEPGEEGGAEEGEEEGGLHALACLEGDTADGKRKGVQRRDFLKRHRFEIAAVGGYYASDALSSTYSYGGAVAYYPSEDFGVEVLVTRTPIKFRLEEPFNTFDQEQHFVPSAAFQGIGSLLWSPIHAKFKFTEATIVHGDVFALAGAGRTFHESVLGLTWEAGLGLKLYFSRFVTFRLDVRDFLIPQEVLGRGRSTNNLTILGGISLWLL